MCEVCKGSAQVSETVRTLALSFLFYRYPVKMSSSKRPWWYLAKADGLNQCLHWRLGWKISSSWHYPKYLPTFAQQLHGLRRGSAAAHVLGLWVRIPPGAWMFVCRECCVLSGRGLCEKPITCPEESYQMCCVWVWPQNLDNEEAWAHYGCRAMQETTSFHETDCT
jgi:hypothetical protein